MLAYNYRFHGHNSLRYVYKNGQALRSAMLTIRYVENQRRTSPRIAVVVSKKVHKSAVGRNRIRRRLYEWFRLHLPQLKENYDIVCIVTSAEVRAMQPTELDAVLKDLTIPLLDISVKK